MPLLEQVPIPRRTAADRAQLQCVILDSAVGNSEFFPIATLNQASAVYRAFTEKFDLGARDAGRCEIWDDRRCVAHVAYNGTVWEGPTWKPGDKPIYDPSVDL